MKKITLYLDMDGVLCNFNKKFQELKLLYPDEPDHTRFRNAVMVHKIFEDLEFMPDAQQLLNHVSRLNGIDIEILTSMGTPDRTRSDAARSQKTKWLDKWNIPYKANFTRNKQEKANYASPRSILIDDSIGCISPFIDAGGHGILHTNSSNTISILDATLRSLRA